jgi:hypothetical protein
MLGAAKARHQALDRRTSIGPGQPPSACETRRSPRGSGRIIEVHRQQPSIDGVSCSRAIVAAFRRSAASGRRAFEHTVSIASQMSAMANSLDAEPPEGSARARLAREPVERRRTGWRRRYAHEGRLGEALSGAELAAQHSSSRQ